MPVQYNNQDLPVESFYYTGTDKLNAGYNLCFDQDASKTDTDRKLRLGSAVEKPATANLMFYAGVVADEDEGRQGPCFVHLIRPKKGAIVDAYTDSNMTLGVTPLAPQNGSYALATFSDATVNLAMCAMACETVDTDTANANKAVMFK